MVKNNQKAVQQSKMKLLKLTAVVSALLTLLARPLSAETKTVMLASLNWEPYVGEQLPGNGYVYEIVVEAFKSVGYSVNIQFYPWARAVRTAQSGQADGLFPEYLDELRRPDFVFSDSFPGGPVGFLVRKDSRITFPVDPRRNQAKALLGMKQYSFGVVRDYINTKEFDAATFLNKEVVASDEQNIIKLHGQRIQIAFIDKFVAQYLIKSRHPKFAKNLVFMEPPLEIKPLYIAFSKTAPDYEQKLKDFNKGLDNLKRNGTIGAIMKKYGF